MTLRKRFYVLIVALFVVFAGLSSCYCAACGFDSNCPYTVPPCYKVTITGHKACSCCEDGPLANGIYVSKYQGGCTWAGDNVNGYTMELYNLEANANTTDLHFPFGGWYGPGCSAKFYCGDAFTNANGIGDCNNIFDENNCCYYGDPMFFAYSGTAHWEPVWDCNACDFECSEWGVVSSPDTTIHYANEDCCPAASTGDTYTVTIDCNCTCTGGTIYVVPDVGPYDANLVRVEYDPNCREDDVAKFYLTALSGSGDPNTFTTVTCTASFFCSTGGTDSGSTTVTVRPGCGECCEPGKEGDPTDCPPVAGAI